MSLVTKLDGVVLPLGAPMYKFKSPYDRTVSQNHERNQKYYISATTKPMATKLGRLVT